MRRLMGAMAVVASVLAAVAAGGRSATDNGLIVFSGTPDGSMVTQLYSVSPSGGDVTQLTKTGAAAYAPVFSPSGNKIAFVRLGYGIYTMNPDGSGLHRLTNGTRDGNPTWSPDGRRIAFLRPVRTAWKVWTVASTGGKPKRLPLRPPAGRPTWTRAGLLVPTGGDLIKIDPDTGRILKYLDASIDAIWGQGSVAVSQSAAWMTYIGTRAPIPGDMECGDGPCQRYGLYLESLKAKKKVGKLIVRDAGAAGFSPDGTRIAFVLGGKLILRPVGSSTQTTVSTPGVTATTTGAPAWR